MLIYVTLREYVRAHTHESKGLNTLTHLQQKCTYVRAYIQYTYIHTHIYAYTITYIGWSKV